MKIRLLPAILILAALSASPAIAEEAEAFKKDIQYKLDLAKSYLRQALTASSDSVYFDKAIARYSEILKEDPQNKEALADLADVYALKGDTARSDELYKELEKIDPSFAAERKKNMPQKQGAGAQAAAAPRQQYKAGAEDMVDLARSYMRQGLATRDGGFYFDQAASQYEEALKISPENKEALAGLAEVSMRKGDSAKADELFKKLSAIAPEFAASRKAKLTRDLAAQPPAEPREAFSAASGTERDTEYKLDLAKSYMQQGFADPEGAAYFDTATKQYEEILEESPGEKDAMQGLASIYAHRGNIEEAEQLLKKLAESNPDDLSQRMKLGFFYYSKGMKDKALDEIGVVIEKDPRNGRAHLLRAVIFEKSSDLPAAIADYKIAIRLAMETKDASLAAQAYIGLGRLYEKARLYFDAVLQYEKLASIMPKLPEASLRLARASFRLGLIDRSIAVLQSLIRINPNVPQAYAMLGLAYYKKNNYDASLENLKKAKKAGAAVTDKMLAAVEKKAKEFWEKGKK